MTAPPIGLAAIIARFGDPHGLVAGTNEERQWAASILQTMTLPSPLTLPGGRLQVHLPSHRLVHDDLLAILKEIHAAGLWGLVKSIGCYCYRLSRTSHRLSTHCWAIAADINEATNRLGTPGDMDPRIIAIFRAHGWVWGGDFHDPMHFQYCRGY